MPLCWTVTTVTLCSEGITQGGMWCPVTHDSHVSFDVWCRWAWPSCRLHVPASAILTRVPASFPWAVCLAKLWGSSVQDKQVLEQEKGKMERFWNLELCQGEEL